VSVLVSTAAPVGYTGLGWLLALCVLQDGEVEASFIDEGRMNATYASACALTTVSSVVV
jgi:hypothetical protein